MKRIEPEAALRAKAHVEVIKARVLRIQNRIGEKAEGIKTKARSLAMGKRERKNKSQ